VKATSLFIVGILLGLFISMSSTESKKKTQRYINLPGRLIQALFSDGVLVGDMLYLSGRLDLDSKTGKPPADVK